MLHRRNSGTDPNDILMGGGDDNHSETFEILVHEAVNTDGAQLLAAIAQLFTMMANSTA
jgi:hypothetical protein